MPFGLAVWFIPESPVFLLRRGHIDRALAALKRLDLDSSKAAIFNMEKDLREATVSGHIRGGEEG